ncbi:hypothetical protein JCM5296_006038 [Sporobolomyces johnsonii]
MSCCCRTPSAAALGASILVLVVAVPTCFYSFTSLIFNKYAYLGLAIVQFLASFTAVVGATAGLLAFLLALAGIVWACVVTVQRYHTSEGKVASVGTVLILSTPILLVPLLWMATEYHLLSEQLAGRYAAPVVLAQYDPMLQGTTTPSGQVLQAVQQSLARAVPFGRTRRGAEVVYERAEGDSSDEEAQVTAGQQEKQRRF